MTRTRQSYICVQAISGAGAVLLQQEVPEAVNMHAAEVRPRNALKQRFCRAATGACLLQRHGGHDHRAALQVAVSSGVTVVLDCGGADGPISAELLTLVAYLSPNETELARLTGAHPRMLQGACPRHCTRATQ